MTPPAGGNSRFVALLLGTLACSSSIQGRTAIVGPRLTTTIDALAADSIGNLLLARLIQSENALVEPDSLFAPETIVIANGEPRRTVPRLAGIGLGGSVQVVSTRLSSSGHFVWGIVEYRWVPNFPSGALHQGIATLVGGEQRGGGWRILHLHSSSPPDDPAEQAQPIPTPTEGSGQPYPN